MSDALNENIKYILLWNACGARYHYCGARRIGETMSRNTQAVWERIRCCCCFTRQENFGSMLHEQPACEKGEAHRRQCIEKTKGSDHSLHVALHQIELNIHQTIEARRTRLTTHSGRRQSERDAVRKRNNLGKFWSEQRVSTQHTQVHPNDAGQMRVTVAHFGLHCF